MCNYMFTKTREIIYYNPRLKKLAGHLRKNSTLSEILLWKHLQGKQMRGYDFHRQKPIDNYIVDFYCCELKLAIEIDGESHLNKETSDTARQKKLESLGIAVLRFNDYDVKISIGGVLTAISDWIEIHKHTPGPSPEGSKKTKLI